MYRYRNTTGLRLLAFFTTLIVSLSLCSCDLFKKSIDDVINRIASAQLTFEQQGAAWRSELDKLSADLAQMEGQVAKDARDIVTITTNQVRALVTDAVAMTDQAVESRIAQAGTEFRCNGNFVRVSASEELGFLIDDLKFWKQHHKRGAHRPAHGTCWIDPTAVSMYEASKGRWVVDTVNMEGSQPIINIFGYNFRSDALPAVDLQTNDGGKVTSSAVKAIYRTNYLISIDLSAGLADMSTNLKLVLNWPDGPPDGDSSTISLLRTSEARLALSDPVFKPARPMATRDPVILQIKVTNVGGRKSGSFDVDWVPEPGVTIPGAKGHASLGPGASDVIAFPAHVFKNSGDIYSNVIIAAGGVSESYLVSVVPPPHIPAAERNYGTADSDPNNDFPKQDGREVAWGQVGGHGEDVNYGGPCAAGYVRSQMSLDVTKVTKWKGKDQATASIQWANDNPADCTVLVHYSIKTPGIGQGNNEIAVTIFITEKGV